MSKRTSPGNVKGEDSTGDGPEDRPSNRPRYQPIGASLGRGGRGGSSSASGNGDPFADDRGNIWEYLDNGIRTSSRPGVRGDSIRATREGDARADNHGEYLEVRMLDMESWQHRRGSNIADMPHPQSSLKSWSDIIDREWQRKLKAGRENRLTLADGQVTKHTCGSIWIDQHRLRMKRGGPVSSHEVYQRSHTKRDLVSEYISASVDPVYQGCHNQTCSSIRNIRSAGSRSFLHTKIVLEKREGRRLKLEELHTHTHARKGTKPGEPGSSWSPEFVDPMSKQRMDDFDAWKGVATSNGGHVLGAGSTNDPAFVLTGIPGPGSVYGTHTCSSYEEIRIMKKQNDALKTKMEDERAAAEAQKAADMQA
ncbi:hypothetical protein CTI12_AA430850 [Artemisia annua]|uniref:Uncharacterized protein n=1 Tax=Artemisia annua TaxID=35608 RepID=A0A2U1M147_ARTAN|nr:hypothetical protein CTI12_AA430850 [Artemisia annua]